jgi:glucose-6-phosphate isomerase
MEIKYYNCPEPQLLSASQLGATPLFTTYEPDWAAMEQVANAYTQYENILVVGHGGSITSFQAIYGALKHTTTKRVEFLATVDPDYIAELKGRLEPEHTVVVAISKSGQTVTQLEALLQFLAYPLIVISEPGSSLSEIAQKQKAGYLQHPPIGGRFTGLTEVALLPARLCGFDVSALYAGAKDLYAQYANENVASRYASILWQLEQTGYTEVYTGVYKPALMQFQTLLMQLAHETYGKAGKGQTIVVAEGPEAQHHTNQRWLGGRKNQVGSFLSVDHALRDIPVFVPTQLASVTIREQPLSALSRLPLARALQFEREGTIEQGRIQGIPIADITLAALTERAIGGLLAFWQLAAVYGALWRGVDPYDQPQVEAAKVISFTKRLQHQGLR